jgi:hypothetical protein
MKQELQKLITNNLNNDFKIVKTSMTPTKFQSCSKIITTKKIENFLLKIFYNIEKSIISLLLIYAELQQ